MLSKKSIKILSIAILLIMILMTFCNVVLAAETITFDPTTPSDTRATNLANTILGAIKWIGVAIAVGMLIFLGIKYVTSSPDGKANLKGQLGIYILGFVFIVGATVIVGILEGLVLNGNGATQQTGTIILNNIVG